MDASNLDLELADDLDEFNAEFEQLRQATGPHLPISLAEFCRVCDLCDRPLDEFGCCPRCYYHG